MGYRVIKEMFCDSCGKEFKNEHDYRMHNQVVNGGNLQILAHRIKSENRRKDKVEELFTWFLDKSTIGRLKYNESLIKCVINGMRNNMVHIDSDSEDESTWYCSEHEIADFIEQSIPKIKAEYNSMVQKYLNDVEAEYKETKKILQNKFV